MPGHPEFYRTSLYCAFYKLKGRPSSSTKTVTHFIAIPALLCLEPKPAIPPRCTCVQMVITVYETVRDGETSGCAVASKSGHIHEMNNVHLSNVGYCVKNVRYLEKVLMIRRKLKNAGYVVVHVM